MKWWMPPDAEIAVAISALDSAAGSTNIPASG
jgi:hypothetical protein